MGIFTDLNDIIFGSGSSARLERMRFWNRFKRNSSEFLTLVAQGSMLTIAVVPLGVALILSIVIVIQSGTVERARVKLQAAEALTPVVPVLTRMAISDDEMSKFMDDITSKYPVLTYSYDDDILKAEARSTDFYPTFERFLGHVDMYHPDWRTKVVAFCAGRECGGEAPLSVSLSIFKIAIGAPVVVETK
jgi:hypothetical protein